MTTTFICDLFRNGPCVKEERNGEQWEHDKLYASILKQSENKIEETRHKISMYLK
ncbi:hypothetical protein DJ91_5821 [Priestia megaterium]|nr:hypothetical protein DJ91_5821 [Priestia megaterium]